MNAAMAPRNLFWTPSSSSMSASARFSASSLIAAPGCALIAWQRALFELDALLREVLDRAGVPWNRRGFLLLVLELEVLGLLVHEHQVVLMVERRRDDVVGGFLVHALVRDEQVH